MLEKVAAPIASKYSSFEIIRKEQEYCQKATHDLNLKLTRIAFMKTDAFFK